MDPVVNERRRRGDKPSAGYVRTEVERGLPGDLLSKVTILLQDSGYVSVSPRGLSRDEWVRVEECVRRMGGVWVSSGRFSRWSIAFSRIRA